MSEKKKKEEPRKEDAKAAGLKAKIMGLATKLPVMLGGVMVIEAVVLFAGFKMLSGGPTPAAAAGAELHGDAAADSHGDAVDAHGGAGGGGAKKDRAEIMIVEFKAPNKQSGRTYLYDVVIVASVKADKEEAVKNAIEQRKALIADRVRTIIAQSDPEKLGGGSEPGLETLRRQVKFQLDAMLGAGLIEEVLVPRCIPFRADY